MRFSFWFLSVCALGLVPLVGCGDNNGGGGSGGTAGTGGTGGTAGTGGTGGSGGDTTAVTVLVTGYDPAQGGFLGPLEGVKICLVETGDCVTTDALGGATQQVPLDQEISATFEKEGYIPYLIPVFVSEQPGVFKLGMGSLARWEFLHGLVMSPFRPEGVGDIIIVADPAFAGATFDLGSAAGNAFYYNQEGNWDADLTETTSWGWGGFTEVSPGEVQVEFGGTATGCMATTGWPGNVDNSVRMPVRAGYLNQISVSCNAP